MEMTLKDKKIVLGVSAGIAAYKAAELLRLMVREGADVFVAMSANAGQFVTPLTFQALSGHPVYSEVFGSAASASMEHIRAAEGADLLVVAPATANCVAKLANGHADDALSTLFLAFAGPAIVAPAMNDKMYANPAVQENIAKLKSRGVRIVEPETGELACGVVGMGRLADPLRIVEEVKKRLARAADLAGLRLLVTAGPTREPIDPVRYITNPSSGKMGYAIAGQARDRGAMVTLISGPTYLPKPDGIEFLPCQKASEMLDLTLARLPECDALVMTAAVGDFAPESVRKEKIKKSGEPLVLKLSPTPDILLEASKIKTRQYMVGFAAESQNLVQSALEKLRKKRLDLIVANDISAPGIGFQSDYNQVTIIAGESDIERLPLLPKTEVAGVILDRIKAGVRKG
ncbi:MAG: bifunctional phosphopantothenoylcysteine decarboxylase/phosphopantothenate--cysteine ligase CoaBC [Nitrospinae bacterium]|nr:bifunctional phosphopantothenoylcysteine decarboxylase/phosphopantothenate--cysteine ligase CoaBC [Nitrospinota bacterium]